MSRWGQPALACQVKYWPGTTYKYKRYKYKGTNTKDTNTKDKNTNDTNTEKIPAIQIQTKIQMIQIWSHLQIEIHKHMHSEDRCILFYFLVLFLKAIQYTVHWTVVWLDSLNGARIFKKRRLDFPFLPSRKLMDVGNTDFLCGCEEDHGSLYHMILCIIQVLTTF